MEAAAAGMAVLAVDPPRWQRAISLSISRISASRPPTCGADWEALELIVDAEDAGARDFYQKQGFDETAEVQMFEWKAAQKG